MHRPLFVVLFRGVIGAILSVIGGVILKALVESLTRGIPSERRKRARTIAGLLPAAGFAYLLCCVIAFSVWSSYRGRDWGWVDTWDTPIAGDYYLMMIDVTDNATIYSRSDKNAYSGDGSVSWNGRDRKVIAGVHRLEVRGPLLFASANPSTFMEYPETTPDNLFFIPNMDTGVREDFPTLAALKTASQHRKTSSPGIC